MTAVREAPERAVAKPKSAVPVVVCVDDELPILRAIERLVRGEPYRLLVTQDPGEALDWVRTQNVALVIADYRMPEMTGADLLARVRRDSPSVRRMLFTGYPGETLILRGMGTGLFTLVTKPWNDDTLRALIRSALAGPEGESPA